MESEHSSLIFTACLSLPLGIFSANSKLWPSRFAPLRIEFFVVSDPATVLFSSTPKTGSTITGGGIEVTNVEFICTYCKLAPEYTSVLESRLVQQGIRITTPVMTSVTQSISGDNVQINIINNMKSLLSVFAFQRTTAEASGGTSGAVDFQQKYNFNDTKSYSFRYKNVMYPKSPVECGGKITKSSNTVADLAGTRKKGAGGAEALAQLLQALQFHGVGIDNGVVVPRWAGISPYQGYDSNKQAFAGTQFVIGQSFSADQELSYSGLDLQGGSLSFQMESSEASAYDNEEITFVLFYLQDIIVGAMDTQVVY